MTARLAGLLERLRMLGSYGHKPYPTHWINPDGQEAATAIEALLARIAALESALEPFARALADWGDEPAQRDGADLWDHALAMNITLGDVRRAALTLKENDDG